MIKPTKFIEQLKPYKSVSHKVWEHTYNKNTDLLDEVIKLDWNEATKFDDFIIKEILRYFIEHKIRLNWYPDTNNRVLIKKISEYVKIDEENIQYFGGSDAALEYIARVFVSQDDIIGIVSPTYDNFRVYVESCGGKVVNLMNKNPFEKDVENINLQLNKKKFRMVYLVNPNNPTGVLYDVKEIEYLVKNHINTLFIIDEAYYEFCGVTCVNLIKKYDNIVITRSFTKAFGLGGFRLGYVVAPKYIIDYINKIRVGKNINTFAQVAGIIVLSNKNFMVKYVEEVKIAKNMAISELKNLGFEVIPTPANFILIKVKNSSALIKKLETNNIFLRDRSSDPQLKNYIRITIGDIDTTKKFLIKFKSLINK